MPAELIADTRCGTGESPVWSVAEQALYWADIPTGRLWRWQAGTLSHWQGDEMLACMARAADGQGWIAGMRSGLFRLRPQDGARLTAERLAAVAHARGGMRFNDGRCDRQGRFWVGSMHNLTRAPEGTLYRMEGPGELQPVRSGLCIPNSLAFSPDSQRLVAAGGGGHVSPVAGRPRQCRAGFGGAARRGAGGGG